VEVVREERHRRDMPTDDVLEDLLGERKRAVKERDGRERQLVENGVGEREDGELLEAVLLDELVDDAGEHGVHVECLVEVSGVVKVGEEDVVEVGLLDGVGEAGEELGGEEELVQRGERREEGCRDEENDTCKGR
jgi:hypothetical protein